MIKFEVGKTYKDKSVAFEVVKSNCKNSNYCSASPFWQMERKERHRREEESS
jgi:hypothetical protein